MPKIFLDPNEPMAGGGAAPAAPVASPTATQTPTPGGAPAPAAPPPAITAGANDLVRMPDGSMMKLADIQAIASRPTLSAEDAKQFEIYKRVVAGDPAAIAQALGHPAPPAAPAPSSTPAGLTKEQADALQAQVLAAQNKLAEFEGKLKTVDQIEAVRQQAISKSMGADLIRQAGEYTPALAHWMAKDEKVAVDVGSLAAQACQAATQQLGRAMTNDEQQQILARVLMAKEQQAFDLLSIGGWKPPVRKTVAPMDNQPARMPGQPSVLKSINGQLIGGDGRVYQPDGQGNFVEIPQRIPGVGAPGTTLSPDSGTRRPDGPITREQLLNQMRQEIEARNLSQQ